MEAAFLIIGVYYFPLFLKLSKNLQLSPLFIVQLS
jgi:hypothetical protein